MGREESGDGARGWLSLGTKLALLLLIGMIHSTNGQSHADGKLCSTGGDPAPPLTGDELAEAGGWYILNEAGLFKKYGWKNIMPKLSLAVDGPNPSSPTTEPQKTWMAGPHPNPTFETKGLDKIVANEESFKANCANKECGYNFESFQYICGKPDTGKQAELNETIVKHGKYKDGYICYAGVEPSAGVGRKYDIKKDHKTKATGTEEAFTKIIEDSKQKDFIKKMEKKGSQRCENNNCMYSKVAHKFICGGQGRSSPLSMLAIAGLVVGILSLSA